jgi:acetyl-CoA carboxylase biotin carboxyl carrier protein
MAGTGDAGAGGGAPPAGDASAPGGGPPREGGDEHETDGLRLVRRLVRIMDRHGLAEVELEEEGRKVRLRKAGVAAVEALTLPPLPAARGPAPAPAAAAAPPSPPASRGLEIRSPMVGTFYRAASPEAAPFVEVGDTIRKDSVVCIIEAMKVMNEIKSEVEGEVLAVLAQNGEAVEFDQPLFLVRPASGG